MRYYKIVITDADGQVLRSPSSVPGTDSTYTSYANNRSLPGALQIELDIPLRAYATPMGAALVRIWGITLQEISAATQLNPTRDAEGTFLYKSVAIYGGLQKGLPLANPNQIGLLVQGSIFQAFGNAIGTDRTLDLIIYPDFGTNATPKNIVLDWKANTPLRQAVENTLKTAFPKIKRQINISDDLVLNSDQPGYYNTLEQFSAFIKQASVSIVGGGTYQGVDIFLNNGTFYVFDGTTQTTPKQIAFQDLIGQPTWIEGLNIQFKTAMRGDITVGDFVKMPPAQVTTTSSAPSSSVNLKSTFEGNFQVSEVRHVGNFRQPTAESWVTVFNAYPVEPVAA